MHRQQARDYLLEVVPPLFVIVVVDVDLDLIWKVLVGDISVIIVFDRLHLDDMTGSHILDLDRHDVMA